MFPSTLRGRYYDYSHFLCCISLNTALTLAQEALHDLHPYFLILSDLTIHPTPCHMASSQLLVHANPIAATGHLHKLCLLPGEPFTLSCTLFFLHFALSLCPNFSGAFPNQPT